MNLLSVIDAALIVAAEGAFCAYGTDCRDSIRRTIRTDELMRMRAAECRRESWEQFVIPKHAPSGNARQRRIARRKIERANKLTNA